MPYDFKREFKELYQPTCTPSIVDVPAMRFVAVRGTGNPNEEGGSYQQAVGLLYGISYTIKMSYKGSHEIAGYYPTIPSWFHPSRGCGGRKAPSALTSRASRTSAGSR